MIKFEEEAFQNTQIAKILQELNATASSDGLQLKVVFEEGINGLEITSAGNVVTVSYSRPVYLYRAIGLICENEKQNLQIMETARFNSNGIMVDCSRNAVPSVETLKSLIRKMALMGLDTMMLYTEDTYEIPNEAYFGYMRGRYSQIELRELDAYADSFGIEMVPCIQSLAHLNQMFQWHVYENIRDMDDILLADEPQTYEMIEKMISACRTAFKSRKIHIGMDEAHHMGRGKYYDKHGDNDRYDLLVRHLNKVAEICRKYEFEPMMWSDMWFKMSKVGYHCGRPVPEEFAAIVPQGVNQVCWEYAGNRNYIEKCLKAHDNLPGDTVFAGAAVKCLGFLPCNQFSINQLKEHFEACVNTGVRDVFLTAWGDHGAEAGLFSILPTLQAQAELGFHESLNEERLDCRLRTCTGIYLADFLCIDDLLEKPDSNWISPHRYMLYQDVLLGLKDLHIPEGTGEQWQQKYEQIKKIMKKQNQYRYLFETAEALSGVLALKAEIGVQIKSAYDTNDREQLKVLADRVLPLLISRLHAFRDCVEVQWMTENKAFGFEVQDIRIGGLIQRVNTAKKRLDAYLSGELDSLEELDAKRLEYPLPEFPTWKPVHNWMRYVTTNIL